MTLQEKIEEKYNEALNDRYQGRYEIALKKFWTVKRLIKKVPVDRETKWAAIKLGEVIHQVGVTHQNNKNFQVALARLKRALAWRKFIGDITGIAYTAFQIPMCRLARGDNKEDVMPDFEKVESLIQKAMWPGAHKKKPDKRIMGDMWQNLAYISQQKGDIKDAIRKYNSAGTMRRLTHDKRGEGLTFARLAECYFELDDMNNAKHFARKALIIFQEIPDVNRIKQVEAILEKIKEKEKR